MCSVHFVFSRLPVKMDVKIELNKCMQYYSQGLIRYCLLEIKYDVPFSYYLFIIILT